MKTYVCSACGYSHTGNNALEKCPQYNAVKAKELGYDAIHDTVHEMCKDEARHGMAFQGLLNRFFK